MSDRAAYLRAARQLRPNTGQWAAYESQGHCVVLAGPGSGKTKTLTTKVARILMEDVRPPRGVACITYNNECARELEDRLAALGIEPGGRVFVGTVHSFSLTQIVLPYAKVAGLQLPENFTVATRAESDLALDRALVHVFGAPRRRQDWDMPMNMYRRTHLNRDATDWRNSAPQLAALVEAYEAQLRATGLIDFDDMPLLAVRALRANPWLRKALLAKYPVLIVDEYQDLGAALHRMVMGLCFSAGMRLFAVGDVDQSIYGFTGARPDLLRRLSERADVLPVRLRLNYRSGNGIVAASHVALGEVRDYEAADADALGTVFVHGMNGGYSRHAAQLMCDLIPQALARHPGLGLHDVAVLYAAAWIGNDVAAAALDSGFSFVRVDANALYPRSSRLMQWLELCGQWCCGGWRTGSPRFSRLVRDGQRLFSDSLHGDAASTQFHRDLVASLWSQRDPNIALHVWLQELRGRVLDPLLAHCAGLHDEVERLDALASRISPGGDHERMTLGEFAGDGQHRDRLTLSTLHSAKGREFALVFMFGLDVGRLPRTGATPEQAREARRLFYVGLTRAKREIHLIHSIAQASPFVAEIEEHLARD